MLGLPEMGCELLNLWTELNMLKIQANFFGCVRAEFVELVACIIGPTENKWINRLF